MRIEVKLSPKKVGDKKKVYKVDPNNVDTFLDRGFVLDAENKALYHKYLTEQRQFKKALGFAPLPKKG